MKEKQIYVWQNTFSLKYYTISKWSLKWGWNLNWISEGWELTDVECKQKPSLMASRHTRQIQKKICALLRPLAIIHCDGNIYYLSEPVGPPAASGEFQNTTVANFYFFLIQKARHTCLTQLENCCNTNKTVLKIKLNHSTIILQGTFVGSCPHKGGGWWRSLSLPEHERKGPLSRDPEQDKQFGKWNYSLHYFSLRMWKSSICWTP